MLENREVSALLSLRTIDCKSGIIDTRAGERKMHMRENPKDIVISIREGAHHAPVMQLEKAHFGHLLIPLTQTNATYKKQVTFE
eukprot:9311928-Prorocentrum_lima.AAC.1